MFVFISLPPWVHTCWTDAVYDCSNGGVFGGLSGMSIINLPQAAVLGMNKIKDKPVVVNGRFSFVQSWSLRWHTTIGKWIVGRPPLSLVSKPTYVAMACDINTLHIYSSCQGIHQEPSRYSWPHENATRWTLSRNISDLNAFQ